MTTQQDPQADTLVFNTLMGIELNDRDPGKRGGWKSDARLEVLAHELVRYMPDLAQMLAATGRQKLMRQAA